jgi:hypothetical protein
VLGVKKFEGSEEVKMLVVVLAPFLSARPSSTPPAQARLTAQKLYRKDLEVPASNSIPTPTPYRFVSPTLEFTASAAPTSPIREDYPTPLPRPTPRNLYTRTIGLYEDWDL